MRPARGRVRMLEQGSNPKGLHEGLQRDLGAGDLGAGFDNLDVKKKKKIKIKRIIYF